MRMMIPETRINRTLGNWANDMNTLVDSLLGAATESGITGTSDFTPRMDICEVDDKYQLSLDLPGMKSEDVHIELEDNFLVIHGTRQGSHETQGDRFHRIERVFGEFRRSLRLPRGVDREQITADYNDGVLTVSLPKSSEKAGRKIEIRAQGTVAAESSEQAGSPAQGQQGTQHQAS